MLLLATTHSTTDASHKHNSEIHDVRPRPFRPVSPSKPGVAERSRDAVIEIEQTEISEFSVSVIKRLHRILAPIGRLTFSSHSRAIQNSSALIHLENEGGMLILRTLLSETDNSSSVPDCVEISSKRCRDVDANNNSPSSCEVTWPSITFVDASGVEVFKVINNDVNQVAQVVCGPNTLGTIQSEPFSEMLTARNSRGELICQTRVSEDLFKPSTRTEILFCCGDKHLGKVEKNDEGFCLIISTSLEADTKAIVISAAHTIYRRNCSGLNVGPSNTRNDCCVRQLGRAVFATAGIAVMVTGAMFMITNLRM